MELGLPRGALVVLVLRGNESLVPTGATVVQAGDKLMVPGGRSRAKPGDWEVVRNEK